MESIRDLFQKHQKSLNSGDFSFKCKLIYKRKCALDASFIYMSGNIWFCNQTRVAVIQVSIRRDFSAVRDEAMNMIHKAFALLDDEFQKLDR